MDAERQFRLARGFPAPVQQSRVTCGSASLTVATMLVDPAFARWVVSGVPPTRTSGNAPTATAPGRQAPAARLATDAEDPPAKDLGAEIRRTGSLVRRNRRAKDGSAQDRHARDTRSEVERFAEHERRVMNRTNGILAAGGRPNLPWPHALGTPPWGARAELEHGAARTGARYRTRFVRLGSASRLTAVYGESAALLDNGLPALLYVGDAWLPRHVTLLLPGAGGELMDVYDPARGTVTPLARESFAARRLGIAGWNVAWFLVQPRQQSLRAA